MNHRLTHLEALANAFLGIVLAQIVLFGFGIEFKEAIALNATMFCVSYARSYVLRVLFANLAREAPSRRHLPRQRKAQDGRGADLGQ